MRIPNSIAMPRTDAEISRFIEFANYLAVSITRLKNFILTPKSGNENCFVKLDVFWMTFMR